MTASGGYGNLVDPKGLVVLLTPGLVSYGVAKLTSLDNPLVIAAIGGGVSALGLTYFVSNLSPGQKSLPVKPVAYLTVGSVAGTGILSALGVTSPVGLYLFGTTVGFIGTGFFILSRMS